MISEKDFLETTTRAIDTLSDPVKDAAYQLAHLVVGVSPYLDLDTVAELCEALILSEEADERDYLATGRRIRVKARISEPWTKVRRKQ